MDRQTKCIYSNIIIRGCVSLRASGLVWDLPIVRRIVGIAETMPGGKYIRKGTWLSFVLLN